MLDRHVRVSTGQYWGVVGAGGLPAVQEHIYWRRLDVSQLFQQTDTILRWGFKQSQNPEKQYMQYVSVHMYVHD